MGPEQRGETSTVGFYQSADPFAALQDFLDHERVDVDECRLKDAQTHDRELLFGGVV